VLVPLHKKWLPHTLRPGVPILAGPHVPGVVVCAPQYWQLRAQVADVASQQNPSTQWPAPPVHMPQPAVLHVPEVVPAVSSHATPCNSCFLQAPAPSQK